MTSKRSSNVDVCVRVRPLRADISESGTAWEIDTVNHQISQRNHPDVRFAFDTIFPPTSTTPELYGQMIERTILKNVLGGFNATAFVYGQTGSGKSFTMLGPQGIIPTVVRDVFARSDGALRSRNKHTEKISFSVSMIEIYNEGLKDLLLADGEMRKPLSVRESALRGAFVHNATVRKVVSAEQLLHSIQQEAEVRRVCGATSMNPQSSRSHLIMRLEIEKTEYFETDDGEVGSTDPDEDEDEEADEEDASNIKRRTYATLNLVDLAGSERVATTGAVGIRLVEGGLINKSLTILTTVIHKLSESNLPTSTRVEHIPYRDSKLTHVLKSALGGNSFTTVIACISIADQQVDESRSTLQFASRAKTIRNNISLNEVSNSQGNVKMIKELNVKCDSLRKRLVASSFYCWSLQLKQQKYFGAGGGAMHCQVGGAGPPEAEHIEQISQLQSVIQQLSCANEELKRSPSSIISDRDVAKQDDFQRQLSELQGLYTQSLSDQKAQRDMLQEMEELCEDLERDNSEKEQTIKRLSAVKATVVVAPKESNPTELIDLQDLLAEERMASAKYMSFTRRLLAMTKLIHGGGSGVKEETSSNTFVGDIQVDTAIRTLAAFIQSRLAMPPAPAVRDVASPPVVRIKGLVVGGDGGGGGTTESARIDELEEKLRVSETQKDIVTDVKLKRMQDLVMRVHTTNLALQAEMQNVVKENTAMKEMIQSDSKIFKAMKKKMPEGMLTSAHSMDHIMGRVLAAATLSKPNGHN